MSVLATRTPESRATHQSLHNLREEKLDALQRYTQADLDQQEGPCAGVFEDGESSAQLELLVDNRRTVNLNTVDSNLSFLGCQEVGIGSRKRQVPESND